MDMEPLADFVLARIDAELALPELDRHRRRELEEVSVLARRARTVSDNHRLARAFTIVLLEIAARHTEHPDYRDEWRPRRRRVAEHS